VGFEGCPVEGRHEEGLVLSRREFVDGRLGALPRLLGLGIHALAEGAHVVDGERLVEANGRDAERADVVLAGEGDHPAVAARHVDDLTGHAELLEIAGGPPRPLGNRLAGLQHADGHGEGLGADIGLELLVRRLDVDHLKSPFYPQHAGSMLTVGQSG
jgi:hypothetical protein